MKTVLVLISILAISSVSLAGNHGPCKIKSLHQSDSYAKFMLVKMACEGTDLATTCNNILTDTVAFDATTDIGKFRASMLLSAFAAGKDVQISTWGACSTEISNVPSIYGVIVK